MKNKLFACDLDNTLIHSYKYRTDDDICIEIYAGREQSFISRQAVELLRQIIVTTELIPVTTRSIEQYQRINWLDGTKPTYAVTSNGANLLHNDVVDSNWRRFFLDGINLYREELNLQFKALSLDKRFSVCRIVDDSFLFLKCIENVNLEETANTLQKTTNLIVEYNKASILRNIQALRQTKQTLLLLTFDLQLIAFQVSYVL